MPGRVLGRSGAAYSYRRVDLHVDAMPDAATWAHGAMPMPGQRVGAYPHGYLLTIGG